MYPAVAQNLINRVQVFLPNHPAGVPPHLQVLSTIRFLAEGHYQKGLGTDVNHTMSQASVSRYLHVVIPAINQIAFQFIRFPSTAEEFYFLLY